MIPPDYKYLGEQFEALTEKVREAIHKKSSLNSDNVRKAGGGQGTAQISWSTFNYGLLNLDNLEKGGG